MEKALLTLGLDRTRNMPLPLAALPKEYGKDDAIRDGLYVNIHGTEIYNQVVVALFYDTMLAGKAAYLRAFSITIEGDPVITEYRFDGKNYVVEHDATRDKFGSGEIATQTYRYFINLQGEYYFSNEQEISDDGVSLRDGVNAVRLPLVKISFAMYIGVLE